MRNHLRTCKFKGKNYLFHCFEQYSYVCSPSPFVGGHPGGQISETFALIEDKNGNVKLVEPEAITFTDDEFKNHFFPESEK